MTGKAAVLVAAIALWGLRAGAADPPATAPSARNSEGVLKLPHMLVDLKRRQVVVQAETVRADYLLEFLLCQQDTKEYESLLRTRAKPSDLHAALLALGLTPGQPAQWSGRGESAKFLPPRGPELSIVLRWKDGQAQHQVDAAEWLASSHGKAKPGRWIFVGSYVLPDGRYLADLKEEGGIISVANLASAVIDVPFESTQSLDDREFAPDQKALPPPGTAVEVVLTPLPGAEKADHARVLLDVDRFGRLSLEGRSVDPEGLLEWARQYLEAHRAGQVVVRADGRALVDDLRQVKETLYSAGVEDVDEILLPAEEPLPPRTPEQAERDLAEWKRKLADREHMLMDPVAGIEEMIAAVQKRLEEAKAIESAWKAYVSGLRAILEEYKASTRPAAGRQEVRHPD